MPDQTTAQPLRPPEGMPHLRIIAMPRDANPAGDIFGGWTLSMMDLAGASFAVRRSGGRVATVSIDAMKFLKPVAVGDEVSCYCDLAEERTHSVAVRIETWVTGRAGEDARQVTKGVFTYVAVTADGELREVEG